jgi:hypothetical protein
MRKRKRLLGILPKQQHRSSNAINFLLLSIVFLFLLTQLPYFVFNVLYAWLGPSLMANLRARQYLAINNLLSVINASSTFILYAFFDKKFREVGEYFLLCQPLPPNFDARTGTTRILTQSFIVPNRKSNTSIHRNSSTWNNTLPDLTKEQFIVSNPTPNFI